MYLSLLCCVASMSDIKQVTLQDQDTFSLLDTDTWSGLTWLTAAGAGTLASTLLLVWSCVGKQISGGPQRKYRVKM